ncbi:amidohydrolase family protein [Curtobacterium sp. VKM Ac-2884]|uniref:amidohydrolase family protein n=1 Tax=Curtobacterium sp. VKM Ac-2884 TaxID=2783818 RepID=UPI00188A7689|nr:amidohydrolase family protein [Curtobacterium sp. VKM Ac-2884]MBF4604562.1 amidohydrolase family protein [Curtobacterium sp. VKM Ac-2884]
MPGKIDVHQHLLPPRYFEALAAAGSQAMGAGAQGDAPAATGGSAQWDPWGGSGGTTPRRGPRAIGGWLMPEWSPRAAIEMMDEAGIETGMLSISAPGVHFGDDAAARELARELNDYQAELVREAPNRFGHFAVLPLPDFDGAVAEAVRALDELHADGVLLLSNAHGRYLGDPAYEPLWLELAARSAVVFVHPTAPPITQLPGMPTALLDFPFDTTRTAVDLVAHGVFDRYPNLRVILSHAGGFLPYAASRFSAAAMFNPDTTPESIQAGLRKFYFDTALSASPTSLPSLLAFAEPGHVLYGSDFPYAHPDWSARFDHDLDTYNGPGAERLGEVHRTAAEQLFPRLAADSIPGSE